MDQRVGEPNTDISGEMKNYSSVQLMQTDAEKNVPNGAADIPCGLYAKAEREFVFAIGRIEAKFPNLSVEKEYVQALARFAENTNGMNDGEAFHAVLKEKFNRYLARKMCWLLNIEGISTYILRPKDPMDYDLLINSIRPNPNVDDIDVVIGIKGPIAPPEKCNGLMIPLVFVDQIYTFDRPRFLSALKEKKPEGVSEDTFAGASNELLDRVMRIGDNAGSTDQHRAVNYLAMRYDAIYKKVAELHGKNYALTEIDVTTSQLSSIRKFVNVIFSFTQRESGFVEKYFVRVDVTEEFPFLVNKLTPYFDSN